jgi:sugar phosphate isomerase/epimerase
MDRRTFIRNSSLTVAAAAMASDLFAQGSAYKGRTGLQIYSLRDSIFKNPKKVLEEIASYGYKELETFGYGEGKLFGLTVKEYGDHVKSLGMRTVSGHYGIDLLTKNWERSCADAAALGQEYVVVPWMSDQYYKTLSTLKSTCELINKAGETAKKAGLRIGYHNHAFEFGKVEGQVIMDVMLKELDPALVGLELDLFWVVNAGQDPIAYFRKYPGRFEQWHVKDMDKSDKEKNADVGTGSIDFRPIFAQAKLSGMKHFYIEQETYPVSPSESVKNSISNLLKLI